MHKGIFFIIDDEGVVEMAEEIEIMDAQTMKRALTRIHMKYWKRTTAPRT